MASDSQQFCGDCLQIQGSTRVREVIACKDLASISSAGTADCWALALAGTSAGLAAAAGGACTESELGLSPILRTGNLLVTFTLVLVSGLGWIWPLVVTTVKRVPVTVALPAAAAATRLQII